jgi:hypothetical protein
VAVADKSALAETPCAQEERVVGAEEGAGCGAVAAELLRENEGAVGNRLACHRHIRRIFARMSTCSRAGLSPLASSFGGGQERLSKWLSSESGMKRVRCA